MSPDRHETERKKPCCKCHSTYENMVTGGKCSSRAVVETANPKKSLGKNRQAEAASIDGRGPETRQRDTHSETAAFLLCSPCRSGPPFLEDVCGGDQAVAQDLS